MKNSLFPYFYFLLFFLLITGNLQYLNAQASVACPIDCASAPKPIVYIATSDNGDNALDECVIGGEYVQLCVTEGCIGCPETTVDLSGWEIEDAVSNDGSPATSIIISSGSLLPGECITTVSYTHLTLPTIYSV